MLSIVLLAALAAEPRLQLQKLSADEAPEGCACTIAEGGKTIFFDEDLSAPHPLIRLDGKKLTLTKQKGTTPGKRPRVGDTFFVEYAEGDVSLRVDHIVTFVCELNDESCEVARFDAVITVKKGAATRVYKKLKAECGC